MQAPPRPLSSPASLPAVPAPRLALLFALVLALTPAAARAQESAAAKTRADFPDRRWTAVTAADGGLAGAGLATDSYSSAYANPALWLSAPWSFRLSGSVVNPNRDDLRAATVEFDEANGFPALGEAAVRFQWKGLGLGAYFSQPHYEHGETRFIGFNPENPEAGGDPYPRVNTYTSATRYAGAGAAVRLGGGILVGGGLELVMTEEHHESVPDIPPGSFVADTLDTERMGSALGGVLGVAVPIAGTWTVGGSFRAAGETSDGAAHDDPPMLGLVGVRYGRTAGSAFHAGLRWLGERTVDLAEPGVDGEETAPSRLEYSAGYAYVDPAGTWTVRAGAALSPRPDDANIKLTRFGVSLGLGGEGLRGSLAYARESESRADGRNSGRNQVLATIELGH
jgi:hypothetical protein